MKWQIGVALVIVIIGFAAVTLIDRQIEIDHWLSEQEYAREHGRIEWNR